MPIYNRPIFTADLPRLTALLHTSEQQSFRTRTRERNVWRHGGSRDVTLQCHLPIHYYNITRIARRTGRQMSTYRLFTNHDLLDTRAVYTSRIALTHCSRPMQVHIYIPNYSALHIQCSLRKKTFHEKSQYLLLLGGELLAERCRTDDLMPSIPFLCLPPVQAVWTPKFWGRTSSSITHSQVDLDRPGGLRQSGGGRSAAAMTRWWSSSGADRARCPKNPNRNDLTFSETGKQPVMLLTVSFVMCLVYGIRKIFRRHQVSKASRRFARVLLTVHVSHP